jgi:hypothetical protein
MNGGTAVAGRLAARGALWSAILVSACLMLFGCTASSVNSSNPLLSDYPDALVAKVYFIRPRTERYMGMADNRLTVELDRQPLLKLAKGEYALLHLQPGTAALGLRSMTTWGPGHKIKEMSTLKEFSFAPGQTYYISVQPVDGEFRGVQFHASRIDRDTAAELSRNLNPVGRARNAPIQPL